MKVSHLPSKLVSFKISFDLPFDEGKCYKNFAKGFLKYSHVKFWGWLEAVLGAKGFQEACATGGQ